MLDDLSSPKPLGKDRVQCRRNVNGPPHCNMSCSLLTVLVNLLIQFHLRGSDIKTVDVNCFSFVPKIKITCHSFVVPENYHHCR